MIDRKQFIRDCEAVRELSPIVLNITNYVAMNVSANALLAIGASPLMSSCPEEMEETTALSGALVINIGCLDRNQIKAMSIAARTACRLNKPWVLDPVGAGASFIRTDTALELIRSCHPAVIRCNASEILALAEADAGGTAHAYIPLSKGRGVDSSICSSQVVGIAADFAAKYGCVVSVSGPTDYITDGSRTETISNGSPIMPRVTAMGCVASALTGAFSAAAYGCRPGRPFDAALHAMAVMGVAGEMAAAEAVGTGSFQMHFLDVLSEFDAGKAAEMIVQ